MDVGMPETAELVIGGLTVPRYRPKNGLIASTTGSGVASSIHSDKAAPAARAVPATRQREAWTPDTHDATRVRRDDQDQRSDRKQAEPGGERREAADGLQVRRRDEATTSSPRRSAS